MQPVRELTLRRVEISLNNFNDVAIPHYLEQLNKHKSNVLKFQASGDMRKVTGENINATRVISQLRHLLQEMETLRQQVVLKDLPKFDSMMEKSKNLTVTAIEEYMALPHLRQPDRSPSLSSGYSSQEQDFSCRSEVLRDQHIQLHVDQNQISEDEVRQKEAYLQSWEVIQDEVKEIHQLFSDLHGVVHEQKEHVDHIEDNVEAASVNVQKGRFNLARAEKYNTVWYPVAGAAIGGCLAGPVGLIVGLKLAALAVVGGSVAGFSGGKFLKKKKDATIILQPERNDPQSPG